MTASFPGIPLVESPIFESALPAAGLTEAETAIARSLHEFGYALIDFPDPDIIHRSNRIRARLEPICGIDAVDSATVKRPPVRRIQDAWRFDDDVRSIAANPSVLKLLSKLYGRRAFPFQTLNFPVGTKQPVHTDIVHFSSIPERFMCGVWLAMEDIHPDSGPLCYVPGSHQWPTMSNILVGRRGWKQKLDSAQSPYQSAWASLIAEHQAPVEEFIARKGQAFIWCANLLHGGSVRRDPSRTRWSQVTHYYFDDCVYYSPAYSDEALGRLAIRKIVDVTDGTEKPSAYLGRKIGSWMPWR
jgi:hypothetical protein